MGVLFCGFLFVRLLWGLNRVRLWFGVLGSCWLIFCFVVLFCGIGLSWSVCGLYLIFSVLFMSCLVIVLF